MKSSIYLTIVRINHTAKYNGERNKTISVKRNEGTISLFESGKQKNISTYITDN